VVGAACDPLPYLKQRKLRKFMGVQDELAVVATGRALAAARLGGAGLGERVGVYLAVGHIPFEADEIDRLYAASVEGRRFSMRRFATEGYDSSNPLLAFRCLPNMPAFHVSLSFDVQGPYFVTYPGAGQLYLALEEAWEALDTDAVDVALVAGVAHRRNFLVAHHVSRLEPPVPADRLLDGAGCLVLERVRDAEDQGAPVRARLRTLEIAYAPVDPLAEPTGTSGGDGAGDDALGPASLPVALARAPAGVFRDRLATRDGFLASSVWELM